MSVISSNSIFDHDDSFKEIVSRFQKAPPPALFHYTDSAGTKGIIESGCLWATHFESTNDSEEVSYGINLALKVLRKELSIREVDEESVTSIDYFPDDRNPEKPPSDLLLYVAHKTLKKFDFTKSGYEFFFVCFSEKKDLLSQWRAYSGDASGFSVGFFSDDLAGSAAKSVFASGDTVDLLKVLYEPKNQRDQLRMIIKDTAEKFDRAATDVPSDKQQRDEFIIAFNAYLLKSVLQSSLYFKHPGFKEEKEWRLVCAVMRKSIAVSSEEATPVRTRIGRNGAIIPYVEIPFSCSESGIRLHSIIVGPRNSASAATKRRNYGLTCQMRKLRGGGPCHGIKESRIPYR